MGQAESETVPPWMPQSPPGCVLRLLNKRFIALLSLPLFSGFSARYATDTELALFNLSDQVKTFLSINPKYGIRFFIRFFLLSLWFL